MESKHACPSCGKEISTRAVRCKFCGARVGSRDDQVQAVATSTPPKGALSSLVPDSPSKEDSSAEGQVHIEGDVVSSVRDSEFPVIGSEQPQYGDDPTMAIDTRELEQLDSSEDLRASGELGEAEGATDAVWPAQVPDPKADPRPPSASDDSPEPQGFIARLMSLFQKK